MDTLRSPCCSCVSASINSIELYVQLANIFNRDEVGFRWSGNRSLEENTTTLTLRDFFQYYNQRMNVNTSIGIQNVPSIFKASVKNHKAMPMAFFDMLLYHAEVCSFASWHFKLLNYYYKYKERITATGRVDEYSPSVFLQSALKSVAKRPRNTSSATLESTKASKQQNVGLAGVSSQCTCICVIQI